MIISCLPFTDRLSSSRLQFSFVYLRACVSTDEENQLSMKLNMYHRLLRNNSCNSDRMFPSEKSFADSASAMVGK